MQLTELAPSYIRNLAAYIPGKPIGDLAREYGIHESAIIKLCSNESPLGASPKALAAIKASLDDVERYPDYFDLRVTLSQKFALKNEQILLGNGSSEVIELAVRSFLSPGQSIVYSQYAFAMYPLIGQAAGAKLIEVPAKNYAHNLDAMISAIEPDTRLLFIANPNNPTGTIIKENELKNLLDLVPDHVLVILDEAYTEYLSPEYSSHTIQWLDNYPNLIVVRTFSKIYGLAGLRVGFGVTNCDVAGLMNRVRPPFNVNRLGHVAANAALNDSEFIARACHFNAEGMRLISRALDRLKLEYIPSFANFITFHVSNAAQVNEYLMRHGVIIRPLSSYNMKQSLRVTIGKPEDNVRFISVLERALEKFI